MATCKSLTSFKTKYLLVEKYIALMSLFCLRYLLADPLEVQYTDVLEKPKRFFNFPLKIKLHYIFRRNFLEKFRRNTGKQNAEIKDANNLVGASIYLVMFFP